VVKVLAWHVCGSVFKPQHQKAEKKTATKKKTDELYLVIWGCKQKSNLLHSSKLLLDIVKLLNTCMFFLHNLHE
jgi:hypothetical protein